jgi:hypothetical protein
MPKTPVNQDNGAMLRKNDVRFTRKRCDVLPKPEACPVEK